MATIQKTLIDLFKLEELPPEKMLETVDRLGKIIFQAVLVRVLPLLSEEDLVQYEKIVEGGEGGEVLFNFLREKVPQFEQIVAEEAELLRKELAGEFKNAGV